MARGLWMGLLTTVAAALAATQARAVDQEEIDAAVRRGVEHVKSLQGPDSAWPGGEIGATPLAGLTLLECGLPATDPSVKRAADHIRNNATNITQTYALALSILFLDRLGDPDDARLIEVWTVQLLAGQGARGGWNYECPRLADSEVRRIVEHVKQQSQLTGGTGRPKPPEGKPTVKDLPQEIQKQLMALPGAGVGNGDVWGDNSNTQFATLALWVARRHGLPVDQALAGIQKRFQTTQDKATGGWSYTFADKPSPAMTCAGLLGMAVSYGAAADIAAARGKDAPNPDKDPTIAAGMAALATCIGQPVGDRKDAVTMLGRGNGNRAYYFFWSLERVAVIYGLETLGKKDWYTWGAEILLANQQRDGSWRGEYDGGHPGADTCFALLFLRRANVAKDLSVSLKGQVKDPAEAKLTAGGVGVPNLGGKDLAPAVVGKTSGEKTQPTDADLEASKLGAKLPSAASEVQEQLLEQLRTGKGSAYTTALAEAIPQLKDDLRKKARETLVERLARMKAATLQQWLQYEDAEIRRAAALACAAREEKSLVPDLIALLDDAETPVARASHAALKALTGQDFGPEPDASRADRARAVTAWKQWWNRESQK